VTESSKELKKIIFDLQRKILPNSKIKSSVTKEDWDKVASHATSLKSHYLYNTVDYHSAYVKGATDHFFDYSLIFYQDNKAQMIWPLNFSYLEGQWSVKSNADPIYPPLYISTMSYKQIKRVYQDCILFIKSCSAQPKFNSIKSTFDPSDDLAWARLLTPVISEINYTQNLFLSLKDSFEETKLEFRKSFKPLANKGIRLWNAELITQISESEMDEIRNFHEHIAGRKTREIETWNIQSLMVNEREAFIVSLRDDCSKLVGVGIFNLTKHFASYSVGIYDRSLFDQPIGHTIQMLAIQYIQQLQLRKYYLGSRSYNYELPAPSKKESSIGFFKEGFSNAIKIQATAKINFNKDV